jgi:hypothetical protein
MSSVDLLQRVLVDSEVSGEDGRVQHDLRDM